MGRPRRHIRYQCSAKRNIPETRKCFLEVSSYAVYNRSMSDLTGVLHAFQAGKAHVAVYSTAREAGKAAAAQAALLMREAIRAQGCARVIGATGNSQIPLAESAGAGGCGLEVG